jgi:Na+-transporting methylmalonyl-CoA/oxaloacetate decarboxylase gamma subunit
VTFDTALIEEGLLLTAFGVGTAFALLLTLSVAMWINGKVFGPKQEIPDQEGEASTDGRDKALAAAIAVSALLEIRDNSATLPTSGS